MDALRNGMYWLTREVRRSKLRTLMTVYPERDSRSESVNTTPVDDMLACPVGTYEASSLCVACPEGQNTSSRGATSASECHCAVQGSFTNCALNGLLAEHAPHSVYVGESWNGSALPDLSGNRRPAVLTVVPLYWQSEQALGG